MKKIKLTFGKVALVDDEDYDYLIQWKWRAHTASGGFVAIRGTRTRGIYKTIYMHRIIMNTSEYKEVDHIDHDGLNNQKNNLRNCTHQQNNFNRTKKGSSVYHGVSVREYSDGIVYCAQIQANYNKQWIGAFKKEEDAARAWDTMAMELFGEFANLNFT